MSMSKMNSHLILQTRNAYSTQRDGPKDKSDQAKRNGEITSWEETWEVDKRKTTVIMKIQHIRTLLQGLQNLSDGRGFGQQKIGPCFKISISFQLTLFNRPLTFNRMQSAQLEFAPSTKNACFCCLVFSHIFTKSRIPPHLFYEV